MTHNPAPGEGASDAESYERYINALRDYDREYEEPVIAFLGGRGASPGYSEGRRDEDDIRRNLALAREKVGSSDESRARWLLQFAATDLARLLPGQRQDLEWEILAFATSSYPEISRFRANLGGKIEVPVDALHAEIKGGIRALEEEVDPQEAALKGEPPLSTWTISHMNPWTEARLVRIKDRLVVDSRMDPSALFYSAVARALASQAERFRFCRTCGQSFIARKRQAYCTPTCSQTFRTRKFRAKNPDQTRAKRREAYERLIKKKLERTHVRIQRRISPKESSGPAPGRIDQPL